MADQVTKAAGISSQAAKAKTGKSLDEWFALLDKVGTGGLAAQVEGVLGRGSLEPSRIARRQAVTIMSGETKFMEGLLRHMAEHANLLPRYKHLRQVGLQLNDPLVETLSREDLHKGARKLDILRGNTIVLDSEDQSSVLMDFCLHDVRRDGMNAIERYLAESPPPLQSEEMLLLEAKQRSWYSLFEVIGVERGVGVEFRDLLGGQPLFVLDVGLSRLGVRGSCFGIANDGRGPDHHDHRRRPAGERFQPRRLGAIRAHDRRKAQGR